MADISLEPKRERSPSPFLFVAATSALLGAIAMGTVLAWTSQAVESMKESGSKPQLTEDMKQTEAWISSSTTLGALAGALASGPIAAKLGRKISLIAYGVPGVIGFIMLWAANSFALVIVGRVATGLSAGLVSGIAPTYVVEISTPSIRGALGTGFQLCVTIGIALVVTIGAFIDWNWLSFLCIFPPLAMCITMVFMPETPIWLMTHSGGDHSKGSAVEQSLKKLRAETNDNETELQEIAAEAEQASKSKGFSSKEMKNPLFYKPMTLSILLMIFQQFSGINAVMFNMTSIFKDAGVTETIPPKYASIIIAITQVIATLIGAFLVDRLGRKMLLMGSGVGHSLSLGVLGIFYMTSSSATWLPVLCLVVFIISFSLGWGPIPWLMINEMTPMEFRGVVSSVATGVNWGSAFIITHNFKLLQDATSQEFTFFLFTVFCVVSVPFTLFFLPETKGKPIDEILKTFAKEDKIRSGAGSPSASNAMLKPENKANDNIEMKGIGV